MTTVDLVRLDASAAGIVLAKDSLAGRDISAASNAKAGANLVESLVRFGAEAIFTAVYTPEHMKSPAATGEPSDQLPAAA